MASATNGDHLRNVNNQNTTSSPSTNSNALAYSMNQLSLNSAAATALPASSPAQVASPRRSVSQYSSPNEIQSSRTFRRSPSSMSMRSNSNSPTIQRSPSSMSRSPSSMSMHSGSPAPPLRTRTSMSFHNGVTPTRSRRSSPSPLANSIPRSPLCAVEDVPLYTARGIASNHFASELEMHSDVTTQRPVKTIVILHDSCYGHRFSRPRTTKAGLASIVERPERIQASVLGVSVAYVRLGGRHDEGRFPLHPKRDASSLPSIPFRIRKTSRTLALSSPAVINVHGTKWMEELKVMCNSAEAKLATTGKELARDSNKNSDELPGKLHEGDLYLCSESLDAMEGALGAVCEGVDAVFQGSVVEGGPSRAFVVIRPPGHHCSSNYPSGFCWLNNVHVGIQHAMLNHGLTHCAILDWDLHHGDGSQSIAWEHNTRTANAAKNAAAWKKTSIGYFSLHDINSYPCEQGDEEKVKNASLCIENAHGQNIWNVHLEIWKTEEEFWEIYEVKYSVLLQKARNFLRKQTETRSSSHSAPPKAAIFISAGFDASEWESDGMQRHKVNVPTEFYARLSRDVVNLAAEEGLGVDGRIISVLEGGYSDRALMTGVLSHISGLTGGDSIVKDETTRPGLAQEMGRKLGSIDGKTSANGFHLESGPYDTDWWSRPRLEQLDLVLNPPSVPEPYQPTRHTALGNFSSPTQSFIAKVVPHRRTSYGPSIPTESSPRQSIVRRVSSPKAPDVDWATAAHELSKLLIPSDRQVTSCKPEELSAAATRGRRERQSILNLSENTEAVPQPMGPPTQSTRMALRERKAPKSYADEEVEPLAKPASKAGRRKTVAGAAALNTSNAPSRSTTPVPQPDFKQPAKQSNRRQSLVSAAGSAVSQASTVVNGRLPSVQLNGNPRPGTAQSIRPESSMSVRVPGTSRVTQGAGQVRPEGNKAPRSRKTPQANILPNIPNTDGPAEIPPIPSTSSAHSNGSAAQPKSDDTGMDNITSGMGKIKLTLLTKAQREAKEAEKAVAKAPRKAAISKASNKAPKESSAKSKQVPSNGNAVLTSEPTALVQEETPITPLDTPQLPSHPIAPTQKPEQSIAALDAPLPPSSPPEKDLTPQVQTSPEVSGNSTVFVPYQPEGPAPDSAPQAENLTWLPPNTNTPVAIKGMKRHEVPVFSSTSPIRFGVPSGQATPSKQEATDKPSSIETTESSEPSEQTPRKQNGNGAFDPSIWEVPETPHL